MVQQSANQQQRLIAVKWFKEGDTWTELDIYNDQFSGGVPDIPSLTIKVTGIKNAGKYFCLMIYDNGETQKALFKLKIIPDVKIYKALLKHREDITFIRPAICDTLDTQLQENNIVVITGREGSGKSKLCLELASCYDEKDYMIIKVDLSENHSTYTDIGNALLIIDEQQYTEDSLVVFMKHLLPVLTKRHIKVILTCRNLDLEIVRRIPEINKFKEKVFIDMDSCLTAKEKEEMLRSYMKLNQVTSSSSAESNFRSLEIMTDLSVQVTLDENAIKVIRNEEPWKGFPLSALLFCSERKFLHLGEKYFTNPPSYLVEELKEIYKDARKASYCIDKINDYCVLVYITKNKNHQLDLNYHNLCSQLMELYQTLFHFKYVPEKAGSNDDQKKAIEDAIHRMNNKYLKLHEGVYEFIHPCLLKAMFLSSESMVDYLLQIGSLQDITEFFRSEDYTALEHELVITIDEQYHHVLCERLVRHAFENYESLLKVADYICTCWRLSGNMLVNVFFSHIAFILFHMFGIYTNNLQQLDIEQNSIKAEIQVSLSNIIKLVERLTYQGRDPWIYGAGTADFLILSGLVTAAVGRYASNRNQTFDILLSEFQKRIHSGAFVELLSKPLDIYGNTFFHYLMGLSQKEASEVVSVIAERKYVLDTENVKKYTPLDIAAFLGKIDIFKILNLKTATCTDKLRVRLMGLAKCGRNEYYNKNSKDKIKDQPMSHKTNDGSVSPEKLEYEGGDNDKKEVIDENKKDKRVFMRERSLRKEEHNKREEHDKKNVLCFEGFMINIVDNEKKRLSVNH
ncbi:unnamed protein product [Mytilus edulis]|uniref:Novel STAND NTPase 3 domain-containing protein n=1 Tax=Mytilus edulis TaxID=6550 RepID=A0A8S3QQT0_MYTED|nr:unnamed protein product [Mytilus edulis]